MDFGFSLPTGGNLGNRESINAITKHGEQLGFSYLAIPDHIVIPRKIDSRYPYTESGEFPASAWGNCLDLFSVMAYVAANTTKLRLLSSVMVVPHRGAVHTAKIVSTIDELSGGRVSLGLGTGWLAEEFLAIDAPPFENRGKITDEFLEAFIELWTNDKASYKGAYVTFDDLNFLPKPVQLPHPPIWIGGESKAAMRRAAQFANVWYPIGSNPKFPLNSIERYQLAVNQLEQFSANIGHNPSLISLGYCANWFKEDLSIQLDTGDRHLFTGNNEEVADDIRALRNIGVQYLTVNFQRDNIQQSLISMDNFIENIVPLSSK